MSDTETDETKPDEQVETPIDRIERRRLSIQTAAKKRNEQANEVAKAAGFENFSAMVTDMINGRTEPPLTPAVYDAVLQKLRAVGWKSVHEYLVGVSNDFGQMMVVEKPRQEKKP